MATSSTIYVIQQGQPTVVQPTLQLLGVGSAGDLDAKRILTHPENTVFAPIAYWSQPDKTFNLDNDILRQPISTVQRTLDSSKLVRFERVLQDIVVVEVWEAQEGGRAAMPTFQFRQFYEYLVNPPEFNPTDQQYIMWEPRNRTDKAYLVELFKLAVGSEEFVVTDRRTGGGSVIQTPLDSLDVTPTGLLDQTVRMSMRIIAEVTP